MEWGCFGCRISQSAANSEDSLKLFGRVNKNPWFSFNRLSSRLELYRAHMIQPQAGVSGGRVYFDFFS